MRGAVAVHVCRGREWRGGERQVRLLVQTLAGRSSLLQHIVTRKGSPLATALDPAGPRVHPASWELALDPRALHTLVHLLRQLRRRHGGDILLHAHDSHALAIALLAGALLRLPVVATRRSASPPGRLWRLPRRVIAISSSVQQALGASGVPASRVVQIPSAVSLADLSHTPEEPLPPTRGADGPVVLAVGAQTAEKGHTALITALRVLQTSVPDAHVVLVGNGPERPRLERRARELRLQDRVHFLGELPSAAHLIRSAQVLAQPSVREGLGTTVLEAMALGTPVVATATGGLVELLQGGAGCLVPPGNPDALAEALARVLTDALFRAAMVHEARARVARYDAPTVADQVAEVYRSALRTT
jgi:glycosyltransferase involved in cell wall biosynthesis